MSDTPQVEQQVPAGTYVSPRSTDMLPCGANLSGVELYSVVEIYDDGRLLVISPAASAAESTAFMRGMVHMGRRIQNECGWDAATDGLEGYGDMESANEDDELLPR